MKSHGCLILQSSVHKVESNNPHGDSYQYFVIIVTYFPTASHTNHLLPFWLYFFFLAAPFQIVFLLPLHPLTLEELLKALASIPPGQPHPYGCPKLLFLCGWVPRPPLWLPHPPPHRVPHPGFPCCSSIRWHSGLSDSVESNCLASSPNHCLLLKSSLSVCPHSPRQESPIIPDSSLSLVLHTQLIN